MKVQPRKIEDNFMDDSFRDHFSAVAEDGKRNWFYPQKPTGKWHTRRVWFSVLALSILFVNPFIKINGQPLFLFNIIERKIIVFGVFIGPQDYWIFGLTMLSFIVAVVMFTTLFGRLWCGWACPQTVFMEMVFRKIEYAIEGDRNKQRALDKAPWTTDKLIRKLSKWAVFLLLSFIIANLLLAYGVGVDELKKIVTEPLSEHLGLFSGVVVFTLVFFFNFAWLRDQACTVVCPYGRLQSVLLDRSSVVVAYDYKRGEPREKLHRDKERSSGDCISCMQCVNVCPTGIDIRNGTQMECVSCTACIDACDNIMDKIGFDRGLIRYTSENAIAEKHNKLVTGRTWGYGIVLTILFGSLIFLVARRTDTETSLLRATGVQYIENKDGSISNLYSFKIFNKTNRPIQPEFRLEGSKGRLQFVGKPDLRLAPAGMSEGTVFIVLPKSELTKRKNQIKLSVYEKDEKLEEFKTNFIAPEN